MTRIEIRPAEQPGDWPTLRRVLAQMLLDRIRKASAPQQKAA